MLKRAFGMAVVISGLAVAPALAQAQAPPTPAPATPAPATPAPATGQAPAPGTAKPAGGGQKVGQTGNPDPGVNFLNVVENPHVRVLQVTLQPGAVRRPHVHNDVTFHMLVPINGSLELTVAKDPVVTTVPGQAYYMVKGQDTQLHEQVGGSRAGDRVVHQAGSWCRSGSRRRPLHPLRRRLLRHRRSNEKRKPKKE